MKKKKKNLFDDLKESLLEGIEYERGEKLDLRTHTVKLPEPPPSLSQKEIKKLREDVLGISQPIFASILGVSSAAVKAWEQGDKKPSGTARRLMQLLKSDPNIFQRLVQRIS